MLSPTCSKQCLACLWLSLVYVVNGSASCLRPDTPPATVYQTLRCLQTEGCECLQAERSVQVEETARLRGTLSALEASVQSTSQASTCSCQYATVLIAETTRAHPAFSIAGSPQRQPKCCLTVHLLRLSHLQAAEAAGEARRTACEQAASLQGSLDKTSTARDAAEAANVQLKQELERCVLGCSAVCSRQQQGPSAGMQSRASRAA